MFKNKKRLIISIIMFVIVLFVVRLYIDNNVFTTSYVDFYDFEMPYTFNGVKILQISDLHNKSYGKENEKLLNEIDKISPNYIFLTGDMVSSKDTDFTPFFTLASKIGPKYDCYYIIGNHEMDLTNEQRNSIYQTLNNYDITILDNERVELFREEEKVNLYGMWYNPRFYIKEDFSVENMRSILGNSEDEFNILLTHNPDDFEVYATWGADLIFSGHVHGGMIRLPFIGGVISPNRTFFPKFDSGIYSQNESIMMVSRGMSRGATGIRIFNQPELVVMTLYNG